MNSHKEDTRDTTQHILLVLFDKTISTQGLVSGCLQHFQVVGVFVLIFASVSHLPHLDSFMSILWDAWLQGMLILIYKNSFGCCVSTPVALFFFRWHFSHTAETFHFPACDKHTQTENEHIANS